MSDETWTADDLAFLTFVEAGVIPSTEIVITAAEAAWQTHHRDPDEWARVIAAVEGNGREFESMPIAPPVEDTVVKPVKHATVAQVAWLLIAIAAIWAVVVIVPVALLIGLFAFGSVACLYGLLVYGAVVLSVLIGVKGR